MANEKVVPLRPTPCPVCGKPAKPEFHPFCSKRCTDVDLNRWLSGAYVIPAPAEDEPAANDDVQKFEGDEDV
jgi:endogenous inhibitor of DNA gyrase (YacG/DUF329 family)